MIYTECDGLTIFLFKIEYTMKLGLLELSYIVIIRQECFMVSKVLWYSLVGLNWFFVVMVCDF
jgi:hypothetical protein